MTEQQQLNIKLIDLAKSHNIHDVNEQNSYFKIICNEREIRYRLPDMELNQFQKDAISMFDDFLKNRIQSS